MFNGKLKKEAIAEYESVYKNHEKSMKSVIKESENLQYNKKFLKQSIDTTWEYLNSMKNKPEDLKVEVESIRIEFKKFENSIKKIEQEFDKTLKTSAGLGATGVAAGAGVAAFGPSAAMAVAMTFGTASTGTAISALSGAAATNAALAWIGGGAIVAGGGGMGVGSAFLALAGPVGWAIGGTALAGAGLFARSKNKKVAEEAFSKAKEIKEHTHILKATSEEINRTAILISETKLKLQQLYVKVHALTTPFQHDVKKFQENNALMSILMVLINNTSSAAGLINRPIGAQS
ncbi:hypothetical protein CBM15_11150 [Solibacillus kalamii]|uniref:Uncharacterized protein n=1 Tax=Solibacillus kalamii TaxID=1748298 RepID=A0ABX3ZGI5_9BACL|nr:hypothetical protein CBM15_11150 [Solibacillus kalamii]